jgi:hypothetical protein
MSNDIATLPVPAHIGILRQFIERERGMRIRVLKGETQRKGLLDADQALRSLKAIEEAIKSDSPASGG